MSPANTAALDDLWNVLQEPGYPTVLEPSYWLLLAALDIGWHIEEPVHLRPRQNSGEPHVYHFVLRHPTHPRFRRLTALAGPQLDQLVRAEGLQILTGQ
jgi:hypothetical protein